MKSFVAVEGGFGLQDAVVMPAEIRSFGEIAGVEDDFDLLLPIGVIVHAGQGQSIVIASVFDDFSFGCPAGDGAVFFAIAIRNAFLHGGRATGGMELDGFASKRGGLARPVSQTVRTHLNGHSDRLRRCF